MLQVSFLRTNPSANHRETKASNVSVTDNDTSAGRPNKRAHLPTASSNDERKLLTAQTQSKSPAEHPDASPSQHVLASPAAPMSLGGVRRFFQHTKDQLRDHAKPTGDSCALRQKLKTKQARDLVKAGDEAQSRADDVTAMERYAAARQKSIDLQLDLWTFFFGEGPKFRDDNPLFLALKHHRSSALIRWLLATYHDALASRCYPPPSEDQFEAHRFQELISLRDAWLSEQGRLVKISLLTSDDVFGLKWLNELIEMARAQWLPSALKSYGKCAPVLALIGPVSTVMTLAATHNCPDTLSRMTRFSPELCETFAVPYLRSSFQLALLRKPTERLSRRKAMLERIAGDLSVAKGKPIASELPLPKGGTRELVYSLFARQIRSGESKDEWLARWVALDTAHVSRLVYELSAEEIAQPKWLEFALFGGLKLNQVATRRHEHAPNRLRVAIVDEPAAATVDWPARYFQDALKRHEHLFVLSLACQSEAVLAQFEHVWPPHGVPSEENLLGLKMALLNASTRISAIELLETYAERTERRSADLTPISSTAKAQSPLNRRIQRWVSEGLRENAESF